MSRVALEDYDDCAAMWADAETMRHIGNASTPEESWLRFQRFAGQWALLDYGIWMLRDRDTGRYAGNVGFKQFRRDLEPAWELLPEIAWVLAPWSRGRGLAAEAARAALAWADEQRGWPVTLCMVGVDNHPSVKLAGECGYEEIRRVLYKNEPVIIYQRQ